MSWITHRIVGIEQLQVGKFQRPFIFFPVAKWCINEYHHTVNVPPTEKIDFKQYLMPFNQGLHLILADFYIRYPPVPQRQESITSVNAFYSSPSRAIPNLVTLLCNIALQKVATTMVIYQIHLQFLFPSISTSLQSEAQ